MSVPDQKVATSLQPGIAAATPCYRFAFMGPPASGKGTQARRLAEREGLPYLSTGGILRAAIREGSPLGLQAQPFLDRGRYLPDELMIPVIQDWLWRQEGGWVLDGFPRTESQAKMLLQLTGGEFRAIVLAVPDDALIERAGGRWECLDCHWTSTRAEPCQLCGGQMTRREDDGEIKFQARLAAFKDQVEPAISLFRESGHAVILDGGGKIEEVEGELQRVLHE